jgi:predicted MFS family arabinose efflux permease
MTDAPERDDGFAWLRRYGAIGGALAERNFGIYALANTPSLVGSWVQRVAIGWLTWELTHSGAWLGLIGFADLFPFVVLSPVAGVLADRFDRIAIAKMIQFTQCAFATGLAVITAMGLATPVILFLFTLAFGIDQAFYQPVRQAMAPNLVRRQHLPAAIAINSIVYNVARFVGPAIAGVLLVAGDAAWCFAVNAVTYLGFIVALYVIRPIPDEDDGAARPRRSMGGEVVEGWKYALTHREIAPLLAMLGVAALCARPVVELLPGFADRIFGRGPESLALMTSIMGVGAMAGGILIGMHGRVSGMAAGAVHSLGLVCLALLGFTLLGWYPAAIACIAAVGFAQVTMGITVQTLVQSLAASKMRGRVLSLYGLLWLGGNALGALAMGTASEWFGLRAPVVTGAVICGAMWLVMLPRLRGLAQRIDQR